MSNVLDARAYAWCNLGPLSEEGTSIAEDHAQGTGVIMYKGTINLEGIHRPTPGTRVELAYSDGQSWIARLPLRLRVLSCFSNPLTKKTSISVGCDFAYYENRKRPITLDTRDENTNVSEAEWRAATPALSGSWLAGMILCILKIKYDGTIPLTNYYTRQDFDLSAGYVEELSKLCASEGYVCRINSLGKAEFIKKDPTIGAGTLLSEADLIDFNPVNSGDLPGDAVYSKYESLKLKAPEDDSEENEDERKKRNWEKEETIGQMETHIHDWTRYVYTQTTENKTVKDSHCNDIGDPGNYPSEDLPTDSFVEDGKLKQPKYESKAFPMRDEKKYVPRSTTDTTYDSKDRVIKRTTVKYSQWFQPTTTETTFRYADEISIDVSGGNGGSSSLDSWDVFTCVYDPEEEEGSGGSGSSAPALPPSGRTEGSSDDDNGEVKEEVTIEWSPLGPVRMSLGLQRSFQEVDQGFYTSSIRRVTYERNKKSGITKTITRNFVPFMQTTDGSEVISRLRDRKNPWEGVSSNLLSKATFLVESGSETRIRTEREFGIQRRPKAAERTTEANKKTPEVEQEERMAWAMGSAASQTAIELTPPYAPDDRIVGGNGSYTVIPSDAATKVLAYARTENRYLLGHRNGNGIQVLPEMLPAKPLSVFYIRLNGCTAAFLVNGRTWNIDPSGVTMTCDALFWGAVDGTVADVWFPMPPGATSLPAPVAITTNASPKPANAINIPSNFNFQNPNLQTLFSSLPVDTAPTFAKTVTPGRLVKPYNETIALAAGGGAGIQVGVQYWVPQPPTALEAGSLAGVLVLPVQNMGKAWTSTSVFTPGTVVITSIATGKAWTSASVFTPGSRNAGIEIAQGKVWTSGSVFAPGSRDDGIETAAGKTWTSASVFAPGAADDGVEYASGKAWTSGSAFAPGATDDGIEYAAGVAWVSGSVFSPGQGITDYDIAGKAWASGSVFAPGSAGSGDQTAAGVAWTSASTFTPGGGQSAPTDPYFANVSALFHFDGANGSTTFTDSSANNIVPTRVGNGTISTAQAKFNQSYLNVSGARIELPASSLFTFPGNFTVEIQCYQSERISFDTLLELGRYDDGIMLRNGQNPGIWVNGYQFAYSFGNLNEWIQVTVVRSGSTFTAFANGTSIGTTTISGTVGSAASTNASFIGDSTHSPGRAFRGHIDEFRVTKGIARYATGTGANAGKMVHAGTNDLVVFDAPFPNEGPSQVAQGKVWESSSVFAPGGGSAAPTDPYFANVSLLMHMDGSNGSTTFTDSSSNARSISRFGNAQISTAWSQFGGSSLLLDGNGDYLTIPSAAALVNWWSTGYTVECWVRVSTFTERPSENSSVLMGNMTPTSGNQFWSFGPRSDGKVLMYYFNGAGVSVVSANSMSLNTPTHLAFTQQSNVIKLFINGTLEATASVSGTPQSGSDPFTVGACQNSFFNGYIDEFRVTKGVARYTANFTPPDAPFPNQ